MIGHVLAINKFFNELNMELMDLNRESAKLSWDLRYRGTLIML